MKPGTAATEGDHAPDVTGILAFRVRSAPRAHDALPTRWTGTPGAPSAVGGHAPESPADGPRRRRWLRRRPSEEPAILEPPPADRVVGDVLAQTVSPDGELEVAGHDAAFDALAEDADARMLQDELRLRLEQDRGVLRRYAELLDPEPPGAGPMVGAERPADDIEAEFWAGPADARPRLFGRRQNAEIVLEGSGTEAIDLTAYEPAPHGD